HEKYSSQLQMSLKAAEGKKSDEEEGQRGDKMTTTKSVTQGTSIENRIAETKSLT
ncbi:hypothetical protein XENORESO_005200, partial [Xenotaenia resolanae]